MRITRRIAFTAAAGGLVLAAAPSIRLAWREGEADPIKDRKRDILVFVFLRFGVDGLTLLAPAEDDSYRKARPTIAVTPELGSPIGALDNVPFYLHPNAPELKGLYDRGKLALIHAAGLPTGSRSHFECQEMAERGITEHEAPLFGGWLGRHLLSAADDLPALGAVAAAASIHTALHGYRGAVAIPDVAEFNVPGGDFNLNVIEALSAGNEPHAICARETVAMIRGVRARYAELPSIASEPAEYPEGSFGTAMQSVARIIKMKAGLDVATVDFGGWDHHYKMNQYFPGHLMQLSRGLAAFWDDLKDYQDRLTVVAMTEFGRRLEENTAGGTDHGAASVMLALGGHVHGGRIYGQWPGLAEQDLREGDLRVTTDSRTILQELLVKRRGEQNLEKVFPALRYQPLGMFA